MSGLSAAAREAVEAIEDGPQGPEVGAFFDLDGTLVAGYTAATFYGDRLKGREVSPAEFLRTVVTAVDGELGGDPTRIAHVAFSAMRGESEEAFADLGERLFRARIAGTIRRESRALVAAHQRAGHTVAVASAATSYQVAPVARDLGVEHLVCTRLVVEDGQFTGETDGPMLWGRHKARGVRAFAREHGIDLSASYAYGNGYEDVAFLSSVGHPTALNPHRDLRTAAGRLGWPVLDLADPVGGSLVAAGRTVAALAGMNAGVGAGLAYGLLRRSRSEGRATAVRLATRLPMAIAGVSLGVLHEERLWTHRPAIFVANHQSSLDIPVLGRLLDRDFTIVAKKEARWDPRTFVGSVVVDPAWIDRSDSASARATLDGVVDRIRGGTSLMIFPEGTRSPTPVLGPFRKGAFHLAAQAGVPVVPVVLRNTGELMGRSSLVLNPGVVDVCVLEPETDWRTDDMDERIAALHARFEETLARWPS
ncbi:HAD-IB family hydrolase [Nocardioides zeicaulis]|uniref:HAD-IB family hydrolase n=1 Tax=Nocardioides zeicaulis TaxID=1776857 RepID=A0ABV6E1V5_9ACTN